MIIFKKVRYKNFLSSGNVFTEYDLDSNQNTLIIGKNGSGKSTLLDSLTFALFGKAYRNINKPSLVNSINQKDCLVEIEFSIGNRPYLIRRGLKPAVFDVVVDGISLDKSASAKDFQSSLETNILKMNYKSFCSVVILGARYDSFMDMTPADRRKVVEDVLDIEIFSDMNVILKDRLSRLKDSIRDNKSDLLLNEEKKKLQQSNIDTSTKEREEQIERKLNKITEMQTDIDNDAKNLIKGRVNVSRLKTDIDSKRQPSEERKKVAEEIFRDLNKRRSLIEKDKSFYTDNDSCPTCMQDIGQQFRDEMINKKTQVAQEVDLGIDRLSKTIESINKEVESIAAMEKMLERYQRQVENREHKVRTETDQVGSLHEEITELRKKKDGSPSNDREKVLKDLEDAIDTLQDKEVGLTQKKTEHDVAYDMLKDSGIKARIIENYLPVINLILN